MKSILNSQKSKEEQENEKIDEAVNRRNNKKVNFYDIKGKIKADEVKSFLKNFND